MPKKYTEEEKQVFQKLKEDFLSLDPVHWIEKHLTIAGDPFNLTTQGWKPLADIYRYVGLKALEPNAKGIVVLKGRQVGLSTLCAAIEMYFMGSGLFGTNGKQPIRVMHAFPQLELAASFSKTKLQEMITQSVRSDNDKKNKSGKNKSFMQSMLDTSSPTNDSLHFKQFLNGNHLWIESVGITGDRVMGRTVDCIMYDEVQSTSEQAIGNSLKLLTTSKYGNRGVKLFFGTPRAKGSNFQKRWQVSTQQYYHLGCAECKQYFPLYTPGSDEWEKIWLYGYIVKCTHCGHEQDKREAADRGKWFGLREEDEDGVEFIGFHINQLYIPSFKKEEILKEKPGISVTNNERVYQNEVLGEFYQGDSSPISIEDIRENCADHGRKMTASLPHNDNEIITIGIDYGARSDLEQQANPEKYKKIGKSYSVAVVIRARGAGLISIEYVTKFARNDSRSKKGLIEKLMRNYNAKLVVGDIGYSNDFSEEMQTTHGERYLVSRAAGKINGRVKFAQDAYPKEIQFEKDYFIGEMFEQMKKGMIRFPFGDYENIAWMIDHCASMDIKPILSRTGDPSVHYEKGSTPNDALMALINAYLGYKFIITQQFTKNNGQLGNSKISDMNKPLIIGSHIDIRRKK